MVTQLGLWRCILQGFGVGKMVINYGLRWCGIWGSGDQISRVMKMKSSCYEKKSKQLDHRIRQLVDGGHLASFKMKERTRLKGFYVFYFGLQNEV